MANLDYRPPVPERMRPTEYARDGPTSLSARADSSRSGLRVLHDQHAGALRPKDFDGRSSFLQTPSHPDLLECFTHVAAMLPQTEDDDEFVFTADTVPSLPVELATSELIIKRGLHDYGTWRIDYPQVLAPKAAYEALGILTLGVLLSPTYDSVSVHLTHERSEVKTLRVEFEHLEVGKGGAIGLLQRPEAFVYVPTEVRSKPWLREGIRDPHSFPRFSLTTESDCPITDEDWAHRDHLVGFGSAEGTARLAELFLNMSRLSNGIPEFVLESEAGFRGVAPASAEIRFWLPGGDMPKSEFP